MAKPWVSDELWEIIEPLRPPERPKPKGGRPPGADRKALTGILFVWKTGLQWEDLPQERGCGCGMTGWRRLRDGQKAGVWDALHALLLDRLAQADQIDGSRASRDWASGPAPHAPQGGRRWGLRRWARTRRTGASRAPSITSS